MRRRAIVLAAALVLAPFGAKAADLVVWWPEGYYAEEDAAVAETIDAFEQNSGREVELSFHSDAELPDKVTAALEAGRPPDFVFGFWRRTIFRGGRSRAGWWISPTPSATSRTCSIQVSLTGRCCSTH